MLIRNSEGDYSPAHRSLLEFFVAYKIVASLGVLAEDFTKVARQQSHLSADSPQEYTWDAYFKRGCDGGGNPEAIAPLARFNGLSVNELLPLLSQSKLEGGVGFGPSHDRWGHYAGDFIAAAVGHSGKVSSGNWVFGGECGPANIGENAPCTVQ
ncbi:MAG: hypothetical protein AAFY17_12140 [Cyanobacteria bacterium J06642_11]